MFQSEDLYAEQRRDYEEKIKSLESIVRMIELKSKNASDHVMRLEEKENDLRKEYTKLHERYTEVNLKQMRNLLSMVLMNICFFSFKLFKTHCDYMDRTKMLFGNDSRIETSSSSNGVNGTQSNANRARAQSTNKVNEGSRLLDILKSSSSSINRNDLINALKMSSKAEVNQAISSLLQQEVNEVVLNNSCSSSMTSLNANGGAPMSSTGPAQQQQQTQPQPSESQMNEQTIVAEKSFNDITLTPSTYLSLLFYSLNCRTLLIEIRILDCLVGDDVECATLRNNINLSNSENFDEHLSAGVEFEDSASDINSYKKDSLETETETEFDGEEEGGIKNDLSLYNELSRENYDISELDDGADITGKRSRVPLDSYLISIASHSFVFFFIFNLIDHFTVKRSMFGKKIIKCLC